MTKDFDYQPLESLNMADPSSSSNHSPSQIGTNCDDSRSGYMSSSSSCDSNSTDSSINSRKNCSYNYSGNTEAEGLESMNYESQSDYSACQDYEMNKDRCLVLIVSMGLNQEHSVDRLRDLFSHRFFITEHLDLTQVQVSNSQKITDQTAVAYALKYAHVNHPDLGVIVIQDTSISNLDSDLMAGRIKGVIRHRVSYEFFYLCKWMDSCQYYQPVDVESSEVDNLYYTRGPQGLQAILFTPHGRDIVLGYRKMKNGKKFKDLEHLEKGLVENIRDQNLVAVTTLNNLVNFNMMDATSNLDFNRANQCNVSSNNGNGNTTSWDIAAWIWLVVIIILVILIAWAIIKMTP